MCTVFIFLEASPKPSTTSCLLSPMLARSLSISLPLSLSLIIARALSLSLSHSFSLARALALPLALPHTYPVVSEDLPVGRSAVLPTNSPKSEREGEREGEFETERAREKECERDRERTREIEREREDDLSAGASAVIPALAVAVARVLRPPCSMFVFFQFTIQSTRSTCFLDISPILFKCYHLTHTIQYLVVGVECGVLDFQC